MPPATCSYTRTSVGGVQPADHVAGRLDFSSEAKSHGQPGQSRARWFHHNQLVASDTRHLIQSSVRGTQVMQPVMDECHAETLVDERKPGSVASNQDDLKAMPAGADASPCQSFRR